MRTSPICALPFIMALLAVIDGLSAADGVPPPNPAELAAMTREGWDPEGTLPSFSEDEIARQFAAGRQLMAGIDKAVNEGRRVFVVPEGHYRYTSTGHGPGHENAPLRFVGITDFTILAYGATFWMTRGHEEADLHEVQSGIWIHRCKDLVLKGFDLDYDPGSFLQGRITAFDLDAGEVEFETHADMLHPEEFNSVRNVNFFDENGRLFPQPYINRTSLEQVGARRYRMALDGNFMRLQRDEEMMARFGGRARLKAGHYVTMPMRTGSAVDIFQCENVTLEDVNIYQTPGFGIAEFEGAGGHTYRRVRIIRRPGTKRLSVSAADLFHSNLVGRGPTIEECEFAYAFDDGINLHGRFATVLGRLGPKSLVITHHYGDALSEGSRIGFVHWLEMFDQGEGIVEAVRPIPTGTLRHDRLMGVRDRLREERGILLLTDRFWEVRLKNAVRAETGSLADLMGLNNASGFLVKDTYFHDASTRNALLNGTSNGRFENCTWRRFHGGLFVSHESWYYMEGPIPRNISFVGNRIIDCGGPGYASDYNSYHRHMPSSGAIMVTMEPAGRGLRRVYPLEDISIIGNYFENVPGSAIGMNYVDGGLIKGNRFRDIAFGGVQNTAINLSMCRNVTVEDDRVIGPPGGVAEMIDLGVNSVDISIDGSLVNRPAPRGDTASLMDVERYRKMIVYRSGRIAECPDGDSGASIRYHGLMPLAEEKVEAYALHPPWKHEVGRVMLETDIPAMERYQAIRFRTLKDNAMGDGVVLIVAIRSAAGGLEEVYRAEIAGIREDSHTVALDRYGEVTLQLIADPGPRDDTGYDFLYLGGIELVKR